MQKSLKVVLIVGTIVLLIATLGLLYFFVINNDEKIYVEDITLSESEITLQIEETYLITDIMQITPANYSVQIMCYAENSNYLSLINGYTIKAKTTGETKVIIKALCDKDTYIDKVLNINIIPKIIYPDSFSFDNERVVVELGKSTFNKINSSKTYTAEPTITYSVANICTYDYKTGKIESLAIGETIVKVSFLGGKTPVEKTFVVAVSENKPKIVATNCTFENDIYILNVKRNQTSRLYIKTFDAENNETTFSTEIKTETNNTNIQIVSYELNCAKFTCENTGEEIIKIYSIDDEDVFITIKIIVGE